MLGQTVVYLSVKNIQKAHINYRFKPFHAAGPKMPSHQADIGWLFSC